MPGFVIAAISLVLAIAVGADLLGQPLRLVNLVKIIGLSMLAGVTWMQAISRVREQRIGNHNPGSSQ